MKTRFAQFAAPAVIALFVGFICMMAAPAAVTAADATPSLEAGVVDHNASDQDETWQLEPQADIFVSEDGYVVVALRNLGATVGFSVLLDEQVVHQQQLARGDSNVIYLDDVPLGATITVVGADVELAQLTVPDEHTRN